MENMLFDSHFLFVVPLCIPVLDTNGVNGVTVNHWPHCKNAGLRETFNVSVTLTCFFSPSLSST